MTQLALIVSRFNPHVTSQLLLGAQNYLNEQKFTAAQQEVFYTPGAFELPLFAQKLAATRRYDGIICLGAIIQGETAHFEWISMACSLGLMQGMLQASIPFSFGVLTTFTEEQAFKRSQDNPENKGREAAAACVASIKSLQEIALATQQSPVPSA